jgi:hypothetical protein
MSERIGAHSVKTQRCAPEVHTPWVPTWRWAQLCAHAHAWCALPCTQPPSLVERTCRPALLAQAARVRMTHAHASPYGRPFGLPLLGRSSGPAGPLHMATGLLFEHRRPEPLSGSLTARRPSAAARPPGTQPSRSHARTRARRHPHRRAGRSPAQPRVSLPCPSARSSCAGRTHVSHQSQSDWPATCGHGCDLHICVPSKALHILGT